MSETARYRLDSDFRADGTGDGAIVLRLVNTGDAPVSDFRLAMNSMFRFQAVEDVRGGRLERQITNNAVIVPPDGFVLAPKAAWTISAARLTHPIHHYTYGPKAAYLILADDSLAPVEVSLMTRNGEPGAPLLAPKPRSALTGGDPLSLVPFPAEASVGGSIDPTLPVALPDGPPEAHAAFAASSALAGRLFPGNAPLFGDRGIACRAVVEPMDEEAYRIAFSGGQVTVTAASRSGFLHAFVTLGQLLRGARAAPDEFTFPAEGAITDRPRFGFRGMHLDVARQVYSAASLCRLLDCMAWVKLNRFHFHLTDDEGWRFDVPGYPELAEIAAWRGHGLAIPPLLGSGPEPYGGVYSRDELDRLVAHARELGIVVIPEVDVPGHCYCVLQALPGLRDSGEEGGHRAIRNFRYDALNPAVPAVYDFLAAVFAEVAARFPSPWIHIGGDEVTGDSWRHSPMARALMAEKGWTEVQQLQSHFLTRTQALVRALGRSVGAWEEAAYGAGVGTDAAYLVAWQSLKSGLALARQGYDVVMAPAEHYYLDMARSDDWWEPGASWAGTVSPETTYAGDPGHDWPEAERARIVGIQACLWSENMHDRPLIDHMIFPRMPAMAETAWTPPGRKNWRRFAAIAPLLYEAGEKVGN